MSNIHYTTMISRMICCIGSSEFNQANLKDALLMAVSDSFLAGKPKDMEAFDTMMFDNHGFNGADFDFQHFKSSIHDENKDVDEWFLKLWEGYPRQQHDGNNVPHMSKKLCRERFGRCVKKYKKSPEQIVKALAAYTNACFDSKSWICGLDTLLERKSALWLDYVEGVK